MQRQDFAIYTWMLKISGFVHSEISPFGEGRQDRWGRFRSLYRRHAQNDHLEVDERKEVFSTRRHQSSK